MEARREHGGPLKLELQVIVSRPVGAWNSTLVLYKSSKCLNC